MHTPVEVIATHFAVLTPDEAERLAVMVGFGWAPDAATSVQLAALFMFIVSDKANVAACLDLFEQFAKEELASAGATVEPVAPVELGTFEELEAATEVEHQAKKHARIEAKKARATKGRK
jgi:hypothetical protein